MFSSFENKRTHTAHNGLKPSLFSEKMSIFVRFFLALLFYIPFNEEEQSVCVCVCYCAYYYGMRRPWIRSSFLYAWQPYSKYVYIYMSNIPYLHFIVNNVTNCSYNVIFEITRDFSWEITWELKNTFQSVFVSWKKPKHF